MTGWNVTTFEDDEGVALLLPDDLGIGPGVAMRIERSGDRLIVSPVLDAAAERQKVIDLIAALEALPKPDDVEVRQPIEFPDRPGLY